MNMECLFLMLFAGVGWYAAVGVTYVVNKHAFTVGAGMLVGAAAVLVSRWLVRRRGPVS